MVVLDSALPKSVTAFHSSFPVSANLGGRNMLKAHLHLLPALLACLVLTETQLVAHRLLKPPRVLKRVNPVYTDEARAARIEGVVVLECLIRADGTVSVKRTLRGLGYGLDESARAAIEQWLFSPQTEDGKAVDVTLIIQVNFPPVRPVKR